ncbi:MAG: hypothetical protein ACPG51_08060 [Thiolinea sp.]
MSKEFKAAVISSVFTFLATITTVFLADYLSNVRTQQNKIQENKNLLFMEIARKAETRVYVARNVVWSSRVDHIFNQRWDTYIEKGSMQWDSSYFRLKLAIKQYSDNENLLNQFISLNDKFLEAHGVIEEEVFVVRKVGEVPSEAKVGELESYLSELKVESDRFIEELVKEIDI